MIVCRELSLSKPILLFISDLHLFFQRFSPFACYLLGFVLFTIEKAEYVVANISVIRFDILYLRHDKMLSHINLKMEDEVRCDFSVQSLI